MQRPRFLLVVLSRRVGVLTVMDSFVYDLRSKKDRYAALRLVIVALFGGFHVFLIPQG